MGSGTCLILQQYAYLELGLFNSQQSGISINFIISLLQLLSNQLGQISLFLSCLHFLLEDLMTRKHYQV